MSTPAPVRIARYGSIRRAEGALAAAGPWADGTGALLLFTVGRARLDEILREDPYYHRTPGVEVRSVREWSPLLSPAAPPGAAAATPPTPR